MVLDFKSSLSLLLATILATSSNAFVPSTHILSTSTTTFSSATSPIALHSFSPRRNNNNNDDKSTQSVATGAILGGLLGGPFGLLFGASIGANLGRKYQFEKAQKAEMERLGITPEMLEMAQEVGIALERATEGLEATRTSLDSLQALARKLDEQQTELYDRAKMQISSGNEEEARKLLLDRENVQDRLKKTLLNCKDEKVRYERMKTNVQAIEARAMEVDSLLKRTVGAKAFMDSNDNMGMIDDFRMEAEDPLLKKFRDQGIHY